MPDRKARHDKKVKVRAARSKRAAQEKSIVQRMQDAIFKSKHRNN